MCQHVALVQIAGDFLCVFDTTQHEVSSTTTFGMNVHGHALFAGLGNQFDHLVVIVETLHAMIARLIQIILVLPSRMRFGHAIKERFGSDDMEIFPAQFLTLRSNTCNGGLGAVDIVGHVHIGISAQLEFAFLLQLMIGLGSIRMNNLRARIGHGSKAATESYLLPFEQVLFDVP